MQKHRTAAQPPEGTAPTTNHLVRFSKLARGKYLAHHYGRTSEIILFPNGPWIVTDITRSDCRVVIGEFTTLKKAKHFLANVQDQPARK